MPMLSTAPAPDLTPAAGLRLLCNNYLVLWDVCVVAYLALPCAFAIGALTDRRHVASNA